MSNQRQEDPIDLQNYKRQAREPRQAKIDWSPIATIQPPENIQVSQVDPVSRETKPAGRIPLSVVAFLLIAGILFAGMLLFGLLPRLQQGQEAAHAARDANLHVPSYAVTTANQAAKTLELSLPANIQAIQEFSIYARCDGYLKSRLVDIGDRVHKGQLLMVIDAPELEKQLKGAQADLQQAKATVKSAEADLAQSLSMVQNNKATVKRLQAHITFSQKELKRYEDLAVQGAVSIEQRDEKLRDLDSDRASLEAANAAVAAAQAQAAANKEKISAAQSAVHAAQADVEEIQQMNSYQRVVAPCDGVITARNVDAGALVSKGSSTNNQELLKMARTDVLRVFAYIPQSDYKGVFAGMPAKISVAELRDRTFDGRVAHISGGMDPTSRTLQTEIQIPNSSGTLLPGMFAQVKLIAERDNPPVLVPDPAIVVKPEGQFIIVVGTDGIAHYQPVKLGRDLGHDSEVIAGLLPGQTIVTEPSAEIHDGDHVSTRIVTGK